MLRTRDAAAQLGVTEAELLATGLGSTVTRLNTETSAIDELAKRLRAPAVASAP